MEENKIFEAIKHNILEVVPHVEPHAISMDCFLSDLGCNSIDRVEVLTLTMEELRISVPVHEFRQGNNIGKVIALMRKHL